MIKQNQNKVRNLPHSDCRKITQKNKFRVKITIYEDCMTFAKMALLLYVSTYAKGS